MPVSCPNVPAELLNPRNTWADKAAYDAQANKLANMFVKNFEQYASGVEADILGAAPKATQQA
jgi:phosphoenolpyruvate carboxykinase (ATP)